MITCVGGSIHFLLRKLGKEFQRLVRSQNYRENNTSKGFKSFQ
jgi:hypothetical protein